MHAASVSLARAPLGLAFEIPDLLLAQAFAESCGFRMVVETGHHTDCDELEEALAFYAGGCRCLVWRSAHAVVVQPMPGRPERFSSLTDALEWLQPERPVVTSDVELGIGPKSGFAAGRPAESKTVKGGYRRHASQS